MSDVGERMELGAALRVFGGLWPPRILLSSVVGLTALRIWAGAVSWWDLLPVVLVLVLQPFVEWGIHVWVLHARPLGPIRIEGHAARHHAAHHREPKDLRYVVMPLPAMFVGAGIHAAAWWVVCPTVGSWITALWLVTVAAVVYEWVHFLVHVPYQPRGAWLRRLQRHHLLHHHKDDRYWLGVTRLEADRLLGTSPEI